MSGANDKADDGSNQLPGAAGTRPLVLIEAGIVLLLAALPFALVLPAWGLSIPVSLMAAGLIWFRWSGGRRRLSMTLPAAIFAISAVASIVFSVSPERSLRASMLLPIGLLVFLAVQQLVWRRGAMARLALTLGAVLALISIDAIVQRLWGRSLITGEGLHDGRATASLPHPNDLTLLPILLAVAGCGIDSPRRRGLTLLALTTLATTAVVLSQSRSAGLGLAVVLMAQALLPGRDRWMIAAGLAGLVAVGAALAVDLGGVRERIAALAPLERGGRLGLWLVALEMFKEAPVLGKGAHVFELFYPGYLDRVSLPQGYTPELRSVPWPHNLYLEMLAERGVIGFSALAFMVAAMLRALWRAARASVSAELGRIARGAFIALLAFLTMASVELTFFKDWVTLIFWLLAGIAAAGQASLNAAAARSSASP